MSYSEKISKAQKEMIDRLVNEDKISGEEVINILEEIFNPNGLYPEAYIPTSFLLSEYGSKLFKALFNSDAVEEITPKEAAEELDVTKQYISKLLKSGKLKGTFKNGKWIIKRIDVEEFKKNRK